MKRTTFLSAAVAAALSMSAALPCRAGEARRAPDAADRFKTVFSWGCVTDEETARAYAGIGVTDVFYKGAEGLAAARKHGLRAYCAFGPHGSGPQVLTPEQQKRFDHLSGADLRGRTPSGPELDRAVNERRAAAKCQYGGEPVADGDLCPESIPCFLGDTDCAASFAALAKTLAENPEADGIAFDYIGYTNLRSCECDGCKARLAAWLKEHGLEENEANRDRFFREGLVGYVNALVAEAKRIRPGIRVAIHLYPVFLPDPLYGRDLTADYVQETAAWYFPWPEEKIADYTRRIVSAERRPGSVGMPFVGLNATPGMPLEAKTPERLEVELRLILANGGDRVAVCGGDDMLKPGYREVFRKFTADVTWWSVPAMSGVQRLPDAIPADGERGGTVRIVAARGEYEPGSFVVRADEDLGRVQPVVGRFVSEKGDVFPADALDLTVVKVWYQNKNGWFSYFADTGFKLCPELLLHDEDLIRVDTAKEANYARITGADGRTAEWWLNPPFKEKKPFPSMRPGFSDAGTIRPVALVKNVSKQFFLTARVAPGTPAGTYRGNVAFGDAFAVPVAIRVLDFDLPRPMAYVHPEMDFRVCAYDYAARGQIMELNGGDEELMWRQMEAILANFVAHGQDMKWVRCKTGSEEAGRTIGLMKKVGMRTDVLVGPVDYKWQERDAKAARERADGIVAYYDQNYGHHNVYCGYGDEPGMRFFPENRPVFDAYQAAGLKFIIASHEHIFDQAGYRWDWHNASRNPADDSAPSVWNQMGTNTWCAWYANQHVGAEDPEFNRRQNGLAAWLSGYSALCNYAHHLGPYNDYSETYKPMVFAYGTADGVIDTLQWEGFREGVDDIRYATLMQSLAREAERSPDIEVRYLAGKAKLFLARFDKKTGDLNAARGEMIRFIESLRAALVKGKCGVGSYESGVGESNTLNSKTQTLKTPPPQDISWVEEGPREGQPAPESLPDKTYTVRFSPAPILGLGGWDAAAKVVKPGTEKLDRGYGGDASCLWTDVATQRGEVGADAGKRYFRAPEWQAMADEWGLHFRLEVFDEQAPEIVLGLASAGSLEAYLAPGPNTPYHGVLHTFQPGGITIYNPVYSQPDYREIDEKDRANCREDVACTADSVVLYFAVSWNAYATRIPSAGSVWDFEPMFWGRKGNCSWNGLKTIHGRSSWGRLAFALTDAERRRILRPALAAARRDYEAAKGPTGACGIWRNAEVGDPEFYESVLAPLVERLDAAAARVSADMDDATIDELAGAALPALHNFKFEVQRLRAEYLLRRIGGEPAK